MHDDLDNSRDRGTRLQMTDVGFHRTDGTELSAGLRWRVVLLESPIVLLEGKAQAPNLDRIAQWRPRAVRLHVSDGRRIDLRFAQRLGHQRSVGLGIGNREASRLAPGVDRAALDDGIDVIAVSFRGRERFEQQGANSFSEHGAIGVRPERTALPGRGQHLHLRVLDEPTRVQEQVDAPCDGHVALCVPQALTGEVNGATRCGASGVETQAGPTKVEEIGDAIGNLKTIRVAIGTDTL